MKEKLKELFRDKISLSALILSLFWFALYFGLGAPIFKNMWYTSPALPFVGGVLALAPLCIQLLNAFIFKKLTIDIIVLCISPVFCFAHFCFFAFVISKLNYFFIAGKPYFICAGLAGLLVFFIFFFPRLNLKLKRISATAISAVFIIISLVCVFSAVPFYISAGATVFAVEDEYQIAFATSQKSVGAVIVNGRYYYDSTNGENNVRKLHKITVPAEELDASKSYTVFTQGVALNTAYLPSKGAKVSKDYTFRPSDTDDGIQIYNLSDTHEVIAGPARAGKFFGDKLDLLILNGDIINDVSGEYQISLIYKLAHSITGGSHPVIFTRGNHECNGYLAAELGKYVGCADNGFYYTFKIGTTLSLLILDTNNDMSDNNPLVSPIANFDEVRTKQSEWLAEQKDINDCDYNFVVSHIAFPLSGYISDSCHWNKWARELTALTAGAQLAVCGHSHRTDFQFETDDNPIADYPVLRGSLRSNNRAYGEGVSPFEFTGAAIEIIDGNVNIKFTNAKKQVLGTHSLKVGL